MSTSRILWAILPRMKQDILKLACLLVVSACVPKGDGRSSAEPAPKTSNRTPLRVSLYPWVPAEASFKRFIEYDFERQNPEIDLIIVSLDNEPEYDPKAAHEALSSSADLLEVDAMILGDLVALGGASHPVVPERDWVPASKAAATVGGELWGVPHWACGYFIITRDATVASAENVTEFVAALNKLGSTTPIAGDMKGEWGTPMLYMDAFQDSHPDAPLDKVLAQELDAEVLASLRTVASLCPDKDGSSLCRKDSPGLFVSGSVPAYFGYSERLNKVLRAGEDPDGIFIRPVPLGANSRPVLFTDVVVQSAKCKGACSDAATRFLEYYTADATFESVLLSKDVGWDAVPRYLFPATLSAFQTPAVKKDKLYQQLEPVAKTATSYPNTGVFDAVSGEELATKVWKKLWATPF
ncbi:MAG: hypothetical protein JKY37_02855 [Nannocystaceae bacterium]|nr:hypothetical protein [Nannocystaceae bacterium]